jgi:hypothetical protein
MPDITEIERLNYYEGEFLGAVDFEAEQEYHRDMRRRHNIGPHTQGIVTGLDIAQFLNGGANSEVDVFIQPGVAVDGYGREIVVFGPIQLTADMFADFPSKQLLGVWIGYTQQMLQPSGDACASASQTNAYSRVQETFQIVIDPIHPTNDGVVVDGNNVTPPDTSTWTQPTSLPPSPVNEGEVVIALDDSVPFQALPDDNTTANWLVPLGQVLWDGPNERFLQSAPSNANKGRVYAGAVTAAVYAPAGTLVIQDRSTPSPLPAGASGVDVEVQGTLTVDQQLTAEEDVWIEGELYFKDAGGRDGDTVLGVQRIDGTSGGADLHIHIGDNSDPVNKPQRLTVGSGTGGTAPDTDVFRLWSNGNLDLPKGALSFGNQQSQMLNLSGTAYGIGVQTSTLYLRSESDFAFYVGGSYVADQDKPGSGGTVSLKIDSTGDATFNGALVIDNANGNNGSIGPGLTFGSSSGEGIASKRTAGGNQYGLDFYTDFALRMSISNGGNVGIGTGAPDAQLNISGGAWDVTSTEGDLKIGNDTYRLKMGVALNGAGAGDVRVRAAGGTNRMMLGTGSSDVVTISGANVGINNGSPAKALDVTGGLNVTQDVSAASLTTSGAIACGTIMSCNGIFEAYSDAFVWSDLFVLGNLIVEGSKSGFVADRYFCRAKKPLERGDVVVLHSRSSAVFYGKDNRIPMLEVVLANKAGDTRVCGIVDEPALTEQQTRGLDRSSLGNAQVGLIATFGAYAFCKVTADPAPIAPGDLLTTSQTAGHAQKHDPEQHAHAGAIIGKALAGLEKGKGMIPILISHQ